MKHHGGRWRGAKFDAVSQLAVEIIAAVLSVLLASLLAGVGWMVKSLAEIKAKLAEIDRDLKAGARRFDDHETRIRSLESPS